MKFLTQLLVVITIIGVTSCQNANVSNKDKIEEIDKGTDTAIFIPNSATNREVMPNKTDPVDKKPENAKKGTNLRAKAISSNYAQKYTLRKYENVTEFYSRIAKKATTICLENNVPPAAILAIAGLESGWNQGYVGRITGNILSLGTRKGDYELPALKLPRVKATDRLLFDSLEIIKYRPDEVVWEDRPPSLKKDYRPKPWAGTQYNLAYFKYMPNEKAQAHVANLTDFVTIFISRQSRIKVYRDARKLMDDLVAAHGKEILLKEETAIQFVNAIGGKNNSFNYRKTWPVKVTTIIKKVGLAQLTTELYDNNTQFTDVW